MRLIDANALVEQINEEIDKYYLFVDAFEYLLENAPTVDAVEVVRCKDCKYYGYEPYDNGDKCCVRWEEWIFPFENDFCSCGERKDND